MVCTPPGLQTVLNTVVLLLDWLPTMPTKPRLPYYLHIIDGFQNPELFLERLAAISRYFTVEIAPH